MKKKTTKLNFSNDDYIDATNAIKIIGDTILSTEGKSFDIDDGNKNVLKFLLLYFNGQESALSVFPDKDYSLKKNILLVGPPGTGKTLLMQVFSEYLKRIKNPLSFRNIGATELLNYQKMFGHINLFTYNVKDAQTFDGNPFHLCINDIGFSAQDQKSYGSDLNVIIDEFLYARYEIWANRGIMYHMTTNMDGKDFKEAFDNRLIDRMKSFNVIYLGGGSRR